VQAEVGVVRVQLPGQKGFDLEARIVLLKLLELLLGLAQDALPARPLLLFRGELQEDADLLELLDQRVEGLEDGAQRVGLVDGLLGPEVVVPEGGRQRLRLELV
jgi:hypothetical protein